MSNTKHTPLPWKTFIRGKVVEVQPKTPGVPIVGWTGFDESAVSLSTHHANARFIVRVANSHYDLLAVCEELLKAMVDYDMSVEEEPPYKHRQMMHRARAAIAAAKATA